MHEGNCACAKTTAQWLFYPKTGLLEPEWKRSLQQYDAIPDADLDELLQQRLFAVTRRTLFADLQILTRLRAWRPKVEVLLPWELRQGITKEVEAEWHFYQN